MNEGLKAHGSHRPVSVIFPKGVPFSLFRNNDILIVGERRKKRKKKNRAFKSKEDQRIF